MDSNPNVATLRDCYRNWHETRGDSVDDWLAIVDDDEFTLRSMADGRPGAEFTRSCGCKDDLRRYLDGLTGGWTMEYYRIDEFIADGDRVVALGSTAWTNNATGKRAETAKADVWKFRDGKAVSFMELYDSYALIEAGQ